MNITSLTLTGGQEYWLAMSSPFEGLTAFATFSPNASLVSGSSPLFFADTNQTGGLPASVTVTSGSDVTTMAWIELGN